jgi:hypothetical protein
MGVRVYVDIMVILTFYRALCYGTGALGPKNASMRIYPKEIDGVFRFLNVVYNGF